MVAPLEAAPVESVGLAEPVGYPVGVLTPEVTTITAAETDRPNEAVFLSPGNLALAPLIEVDEELVDETGAGDRDRRSFQVEEDQLVRDGLDRTMQFLGAFGKLPENVTFELCADPEDIGISHLDIAAMETRGYANSGYGQRAEGKELFENAFRGYDPEDREGDLRFVMVVETDPETQQRIPVAFFNYFKVRSHLFPECTEAADAFVATEGLDEEPGKYIVSKLVADPERARDMRDMHRFALVGTMISLANANNGAFVETQAQPATRRMIRTRGEQYLPGLRTLLDLELEEYRESGGGVPSKMLLYIPKA